MSNIRVGDKVIIGHISIPGLYIDPGTIGEIDAFAPRPSSDVRIKALEGARKGKGFWVDRKTALRWLQERVATPPIKVEVSVSHSATGYVIIRAKNMGNKQAVLTSYNPRTYKEKELEKETLISSITLAATEIFRKEEERRKAPRLNAKVCVTESVDPTMKVGEVYNVVDGKLIFPLAGWLPHGDYFYSIEEINKAFNGKVKFLQLIMEN